MTGEELLDVGAGESAAEPASPKVARLQQGYCARNGCDSRFCRLTFRPHPDLGWAQAFSPPAAVEPEQSEEEKAVEAEALAWKRAQRWRLAGRVGTGLFVLGMLYIARQYYVSRAIPFLREPEKFQTDPASLEEGPPR